MEADGGRVVYRVDADEVFLLNGTAGLIWDHLDGTGTVGDLVIDLAGAFDAAAAEIEPQVTTLLDALDRQGLLAGSTSGEIRREVVGGARQLVDPPSPCTIPASTVPWAPGFTVVVGGIEIGVRTTVDLDAILRRALVPIMVDDAATRVSLSLRPAAGEDGFHTLYWRQCAAVRTRDASRLTASFLAHLGCHGDQDGVLRTFLTSVQRSDGRIVLFPAERGWIAQVERRLRAEGAIISDWPYANIELNEDGRVWLVLEEPELPADVSESVAALLGELPHLASEQRIAAGRHEVDHLALVHPASAADTVYVMFSQLPRRSVGAFDALARLLAAVPAVLITVEPSVIVAAALGER
jgi:hypothetical protein